MQMLLPACEVSMPHPWPSRVGVLLDSSASHGQGYF